MKTVHPMGDGVDYRYDQEGLTPAGWSFYRKGVRLRRCTPQEIKLLDTIADHEEQAAEYTRRLAAMRDAAERLAMACRAFLNDPSRVNKDHWTATERRGQIALDALKAALQGSSEREGMRPPRLVILESPYSGDVELNIEYARLCLNDCLARGEAPIASHLLFTQPGVLDDNRPQEREAGIRAGVAWYRVAEAAVFYTDLGISEGMRRGQRAAERAGVPVEQRSIPDFAARIQARVAATVFEGDRARGPRA